MVRNKFPGGFSNRPDVFCQSGLGQDLLDGHLWVRGGSRGSAMYWRLVDDVADA